MNKQYQEFIRIFAEIIKEHKAKEDGKDQSG